MHSLSEIEAAIAQLPFSEVQKLATWLQSYLAIAQDIEIEEDVRSGRVDRLMQRAKAEIEAHRWHE